MATDTAGRYIPDDAPETYTYNNDGTISTVTKSHNSETWIASYTWSGGNLISYSGWVKQS
jgi:hypothetical protein